MTPQPNPHSAGEAFTSKSQKDTQAMSTIATDQNSFIVPLASLVVNHDDNPRGNIEKEALDKLTEDVKTRGVLEPVLCVRHESHTDANPKFALVAGYRRYQASKAAKLPTIPIRVIATTHNVEGVKATDRERANRFIASLVENEAREDLTVIDRCRAAKKMRDMGMTNEGVAKILKKSEGSVSNYYRIGSLSEKTLAKLSKTVNPLGAGVFVLSKKPTNEEEEAAALAEWHTSNGSPGKLPRTTPASEGGPATNGPAENGPADGGPSKSRAAQGERKKNVSTDEIDAVIERLRCSEFFDDKVLTKVKVASKTHQPFSDAEAIACAILLLDSLTYGVKNDSKGPYAFIGIEDPEEEKNEELNSAKAAYRDARESVSKLRGEVEELHAEWIVAKKKGADTPDAKAAQLKWEKANLALGTLKEAVKKAKEALDKIEKKPAAAASLPSKGGGYLMGSPLF